MATPVESEAEESDGGSSSVSEAEESDGGSSSVSEGELGRNPTTTAATQTKSSTSEDTGE